EDGPLVMPEDPYAYVVAAFQALPPPDYVPGPEEPEQAPPSPDTFPSLIQMRIRRMMMMRIWRRIQLIIPLSMMMMMRRRRIPLEMMLMRTAESPGYIPESNPDEDPEEDNDEDPEEDLADYPADHDDEEEEEEPSGDDADEEDEEKDEDDDKEEEHPASGHD
nr:hypothetical protein [Tanacetum cinerariifolium]